MNLKEFREQEKTDRNLYWRLQDGERQVLLDEALEIIEKYEEHQEIKANSEILEEIKKEFDRFPIKKILYDTDEGQTFIAELIAVDKKTLWQFIEQKLTEAIKQNNELDGLKRGLQAIKGEAERQRRLAETFKNNDEAYKFHTIKAYYFEEVLRIIDANKNFYISNIDKINEDRINELKGDK